MDSLRDIFVGFFTGQGTDVVGAMSAFNEVIKGWATSLNIPAIVFYAVGAVLALILGLFAYKAIRLLMGLTAGAVAYFLIGGTVCDLVLSIFNFQLHDVVRYIICGVFAVLFFIIGFAKFRYVILGLMAAIGYVVTLFYTSPYIEGVVPAIAGAILLAILSVLFLRLAYIVATSFAFGCMMVYMLSCAFPQVEVLNMQENWLALAIAGGVALLMMIVQLLITHNQDHPERRKGKPVRRKAIITEY